MERRQLISSASSDHKTCPSPGRTVKPASAPSALRLEQLHGLIGNRALAHQIQAKLSIGNANGPHEQEADRVADEVMRMPDPASPTQLTTLTPKIQRACAGCESEEEINRKIEDEDEETVQTKSDAGSRSHGPAASARIDAAISRSGTTLPNSTKTFMESRFNYSFGHVRIHADEVAAEAAQAVNARAFTLGNHVVFGRGQYAPDSEDGRRLLAHEFTHVVQQGKGGFQVQRAIEMRPPGRGEATAFDRRQELVDRLNAQSPAIQYRLDGRRLLYNIINAGTLTSFDRQMRDFIDRAEVVPLRLITSAGRVAGDPLWVDSLQEGYLDVEDMLTSSDVSFQMNLVHIMVERLSVRNYEPRIGMNMDREFHAAHGRGLDAEAEYLRNLVGDPTIRFTYEETRPNGTSVFGFRSREGYQIFHVFRGPQRRRRVRGGDVFVQMRDGRRLTIDQLIAERAAAAAPVAPPVLAPPPGP